MQGKDYWIQLAYLESLSAMNCTASTQFANTGPGQSTQYSAHVQCPYHNSSKSNTIVEKEKLAQIEKEMLISLFIVMWCDVMDVPPIKSWSRGGRTIIGMAPSSIACRTVDENIMYNCIYVYLIYTHAIHPIDIETYLPTSQ